MNTHYGQSHHLLQLIGLRCLRRNVASRLFSPGFIFSSSLPPLLFLASPCGQEIRSPDLSFSSSFSSSSFSSSSFLVGGFFTPDFLGKQKFSWGWMEEKEEKILFPASAPPLLLRLTRRDIVISHFLFLFLLFSLPPTDFCFWVRHCFLRQLTN